MIYQDYKDYLLIKELKDAIYDTTSRFFNQIYPLDSTNKEITIQDLLSRLNQLSWFLDTSDHQALGMDSQQYSEFLKIISDRLVNDSENLFDQFVSKLNTNHFIEFVTIIDNDKYFQIFKDALAPVTAQSITALKNEISNKAKTLANKLKMSFPPDDTTQKINGLKQIIERLSNLYKTGIVTQDELKTLTFLLASEYCNLECKKPCQAFDENEVKDEVKKLKNTDFKRLENRKYNEFKTKYRPYQRGDTIVVKNQKVKFQAYVPEHKRIQYLGKKGISESVDVNEVPTPNNIPIEILFNPADLDNYCRQEARRYVEEQKSRIANAPEWLKNEKLQEISDNNIKNGYIFHNNSWLTPKEYLEELLKTVQ